MGGGVRDGRSGWKVMDMNGLSDDNQSGDG